MGQFLRWNSAFDLIGISVRSISIWLLNLPDPIDSIRNNPDYSIRLASKRNGASIWEPSSGYNNLGVTLHVK
ncbi:hypothetical protein [Novipirellula artificiosorum]|nr:hypothetical protein [Novipirellula artificiosorum]